MVMAMIAITSESRRLYSGQTGSTQPQLYTVPCYLRGQHPDKYVNVASSSHGDAPAGLVKPRVCLVDARRLGEVPGILRLVVRRVHRPGRRS